MATLREVKKRIRTVKSNMLFALILLVASSAYGFDGHRKGFVLSGGLGFAPVSKWSGDIGLLSFAETGGGIGLNFVIGHAWNEQNMIVYEENGTFWSSDALNQSVFQAFSGAAWYHYFAINEQSSDWRNDKYISGPFTALGLGIYSFDGENFSANDPGIAVLVGGGFEFARHWQFGGYLSIGQTSDAGVDFSHYHLNFLVSGVAF